ncbi:ABC transporter permease [Mameliella alba]|nr:ABC transporter permease [Mameliella sediminis]MBY6116131.1 ABC transporter permease [Antarctobacter heliothermus]MBY6146096.1 ABC transporter permease [Mameliella alba]MBY6161801.1 ABC transporter permease [Mameliella alba]MBY6170271.1 ABC transporter permease [Mameliella alba]
MIASMILKRFLGGVLMIFVISILIFVLTQILPGDAAEIRLGQNATPDSLQALREELGLDRPLLSQYVAWLGNLLTGDLGVSNAGGATITQLIGDRLGNTLFLATIVTLIAVPLSLVLGFVAAIYAGQATDRVITFTTLCLISVPDFFVAVILILLLAVWLGLVPAVSFLSGSEGFWETLHVLALPIGTLVALISAQMIRMTRAGILNVMNSPYIEMAILKGIPRRRIVMRHAFLNAVGPVANIIALNLSYLIGGIVIVETIFAYPGLAKLMVDGVRTRDIPLVQACAMIFCTSYVLLILAADIIAILNNPRLRFPK